MNESKRSGWLRRVTPERGLTALHVAAWAGNIEGIKILVRYGADINVTTESGLSLMHVAAQGNKAAVMV